MGDATEDPVGCAVHGGDKAGVTAVAAAVRASGAARPVEDTALPHSAACASTDDAPGTMVDAGSDVDNIATGGAAATDGATAAAARRPP